jgi:thiol:disulfide interchange protein DsbD
LFEIVLSEGGTELVTDAVDASVNDDALNQALYGMQPVDIEFLESGCEQLYGGGSAIDSQDKSSMWRIFVLGFLGGLLSLLTPCVFPMIPLTVSYFTKKSDQRSSGLAKAGLYGFFIVLVYLIFSVPFHLLDSVNPDILNDISTNVVLNIVFFVIFIAFAFSFFGYYELTLPNSWMSKTTRGESIGGVLGIFFMALTLALVSFSCTGPILGSLLAGSLSSDGGAWQLTVGMGGFGLALGLPFALFALFPNMLKALPKSGGWLNTTKVILGFLELALALKFLSNADLVQHWGVLKIELFLVLWILIFVVMALYLMGVVKFPHDGGRPKFSFVRISGIVLVFAFVVYLISGLRVNPETQGYVPLKLLSGLTPPSGYSVFYPNDCPNNLDCFKDLKQGLAYAQSVDKPVLLDFTGYACVNCRKMEEHVWPNSTIDHFLRDDYVLISLYVDDKKPLPEEQQLVSNRVGGGTRLLENYGHKWANFQTHFFQTNSQPYYVLLSADGKKVLTQPIGYTPDAAQFADFLRCGLKTWKAL